MLTVTAIQKAKPTEKQYRMVDERGLVLLVRPNGAKLWQLRYRHEGKEKTASLGQFPDVSLSDARVKRDDLRKLVAAGSDPVAAKRTERQAKALASENTFEIVARLWYEHWKGPKNPRHAGYVLARLEADVFPAIGSRPIAEILAPELVAMVKAIEKRGALDIAKRCLQMSGQVFRYAIAHGVGGTTRNPATDIKPTDVLTPRTKENYARVDVRELPLLLRKIEAYQGTPTTRLAIKLMALTFVRTGELIGARWTEFDLESARWDIHRDEAQCHCHVLILPLLSNGRMNASTLVGDDRRLRAMHDQFHEVVASSYGFKKAPARLSGAQKTAAATAVSSHLANTSDPALQSKVWPIFRNAIQNDPVPYAMTLGIELKAPVKPLQTMAQIFTATGKGGNRE